MIDVESICYVVNGDFFLSFSLMNVIDSLTERENVI